MSRWLPHPRMSAALAVTWLLLQQTMAPGHVLLGLVLAIALPLATRSFLRPAAVRIGRPVAIARLGLVVLVDIVRSNLEVARRVIGDEDAIRPGYVRVPLCLDDPHAIAALAGIVTMTPGTLSAEITADRRELVVHCFHLDDPAAVVAAIRDRYEAPLKEIFR